MFKELNRMCREQGLFLEKLKITIGISNKAYV